MIKFNDKTIVSVYSGEKVIEKIYKGTLKVYEGWRNLIASGVPPLTLTKCKGVDLIDYKLYGNSVQDGTPTPDAPIEIESVGIETSANLALPNEYQQVEYIESTGEQWLDTQWYDKNLTKIELDFIYTGLKYNSTNIYYMGANAGNLLMITEDGYMNVAGNLSTSIKATVGERYNVSLYRDENGKRSGVINGVSMTGSNTNISVTIPFNLFKLGGSDTASQILGKMYSCKIYDNDILVRDFIPCYRKLDNVIGMYDLVTDTFYTNKGTGAFLKGKNKNVYKIPVKASRDLNYLTYLNGYRIGDDNQISPSIGLKCTNEYIEVLPNTKNQLFLDGAIETNYYLSIPCYDKNKNFIKRLTNAWAIDTSPKTIEFTTPDNCYFIKLNIPNKNYDVRLNPITTNIYLEQPLRKVYDVVDVIDFEKGQMNSLIDEIILNGSEAWEFNVLASGNHRFNFWYANGDGDTANDVIDKCKCSHFRTTETLNDINAQGLINCMYQWNRRFYFYTDPEMFPDLDTWKNWLAENNVTLQFKLISTKELIKEIELPNIPTHKGTTILEVDTNVQPSNMEVVYKGKR